MARLPTTPAYGSDMPVQLRDERPFEAMVGYGGYVGFNWSTINKTPGPDDPYIVPGTKPGRPNSGHDILNVHRWQLEHEYETLAIYGSGGNGSPIRRRVFTDFRFSIWLPMNLHVARPPTTPAKGPMSQPFMEGRLEGYPHYQFRIAIWFLCGDPSWWSNPEMQSVVPVITDQMGVFHYCHSVLIDKVVETDSSEQAGSDGDVVTYLVTGHGSAPLQRFVNNNDCGYGGLGIEDPLKPAGA